MADEVPGYDTYGGGLFTLRSIRRDPPPRCLPKKPEITENRFAAGEARYADRLLDRSRVPVNPPADRIGRVVEVVSWERESETASIVVTGDLERITVTDHLRFGKKLTGWVIDRHERAPGKLLLTVSSKFCPAVGARLSLVS
jgi:hypothetical protein